jgi:hypothetical protein
MSDTTNCRVQVIAHGLQSKSPDLQPFAIVIACEEQREYVKSQIDVDMACGSQAPCDADSDGAAMRRVRHLADAMSGLEWLAMN